MSGCIFCDIVAGSAPASVICRDEHALVILDLFPIREGHALVIPLRHAPLVGELDAQLAGHLFNLARQVIAAQRAAGLPVQGHNLVVNDGKAANQHVPHVHVHVIPRRGGDTLRMLMRWWTRMLPLGSMERRRQKLDRLAARLAEHMVASDL